MLKDTSTHAEETALLILQLEPAAFFGSSVSLFSSVLEPVAGSSGGRLSCWWVNLCHADLRKPSPLWDSAAVEKLGELLDVDGVSLLGSVERPMMLKGKWVFTLSFQDSSLSLHSGRSAHLLASPI